LEFTNITIRQNDVDPAFFNALVINQKLQSTPNSFILQAALIDRDLVPVIESLLLSDPCGPFQPSPFEE
jgi:hypothetical protein